MKLSSKNPITMKSFSQPNFYFSAYPLKAIGKSEPETKSYLHIRTRRDGKVKYAEGLKVLPMVNPYSEKEEMKLTEKIKKQIQPDHVEERDSEWFASYE
jgi:hypothetical protein